VRNAAHRWHNAFNNGRERIRISIQLFSAPWPNHRTTNVEERLTKMRFTLLTLLAFMTLVAIALVTICRPNSTVVDLLRGGVILSGCAALAVGFLSTGRTRRFALTYGIFSLASLGLEACPSSLALWVSQTAPYPVPVPAAGAGFGGGGLGAGYAIAKLVMTLTEYWFAVFVAIVAGAIAAGFRPSRDDASQPRK
jgi:hypothetical protein